MRTRKLLLACTALSAAIGCGGKKPKEREIYGNPKGTHYDKSLVDAGTDAPPAPTDAAPATEPTP